MFLFLLLLLQTLAHARTNPHQGVIKISPFPPTLFLSDNELPK
jgi:hypothetical protein